MPKQPRRNRAVRTPARRAACKRFGRRALAQLPKLSDRFHQGKIRRGKRVRPAQSEKQVAMRGPRTDPMQGVERSNCCVIGHRREGAQIQNTSFELVSEPGQVRGFLSRDADSA